MNAMKNITKNMPELRFPEFSGEWKLEKFDNIFLKKSYKNYQINKSEYLSNGLYPVIDQGKEKIVGYSNDFDKTINASENNIIVFGDHTREIKFIDFDCIIGADGTQLLRIKGNFDLKFFYYQLLNKKIPNMGYARHFKFLKKINFSYPSLPEQQKIAAFLTAVDKKIELTDKKIKHLENYKKGLMQKLLTGKIRFPEFNDEWRVVRLQDVIKRISTGLNPRNNFKLGYGQNYYITIKNINNGKLNLSKCEKIDDDALFLINKRSNLQKYDIIISSIGNIGEAYLLKSAPVNWNINESVFSLKTNNKIIPEFLYYIITNDISKTYFENNSTGSSFKSIKIKDLKNMPFDFPSLPEQQKIASFLSAVDKKIELVTKKLENLKAYKKGLLQKMFV